MNENVKIDLKIDCYKIDNCEWIAQLKINDEVKYFTGKNPSVAVLQAVDYIESLGKIAKIEIV